MRFYTTEQIGPTRRRTPEGFLLCEGVRLARTGTLIYGPDEVPIEAGGDGVVRIHREEQEVFRTESLASINGKPVVNDHPEDDVDPDNWEALACGSALHPRRGEGADDCYVVADLLITRRSAIDAVESGKSEISLGYDAEYEQIDVGLGRQRNIVVNHIALVDKGRCGPTCAIGDHAMPAQKLTVGDRIATLLGFKDKAALAKVLDDEGDIGGLGTRTDGVGGQTINLNMGGGSVTKTPDEKAEDEDPSEARFKKMEDAFKDLAKSVADALKSRDSDEERTDDGEGEEEEGKSERTGDAAFKDLVSDLAIVAPGLKAPTFDAKADKKTRDARICACQRRALTAAFATEDGKEALDRLLRGRTVDGLTPAQVGVTFDAAVALMSAANNAGFNFMPSRTNDTPVNPIASLNKANADFWKTH